MPGTAEPHEDHGPGGGAPPGSHGPQERLAGAGCGPTQPSGRWQRLLDAASLGLLASYLVVTVPTSLVQAVRHVRDDVHHLRESAVEARGRVFGAEFVAGIERIREALGPDEPYLLIDGGAPQEGAALWVRYELAPRPALFFRDPRADDAQWLRKRIPRAVRWVVVAPGGRKPPVLYRRYQYVQELEQAR